jgi:hypothetical protein
MDEMVLRGRKNTVTSKVSLKVPTLSEVSYVSMYV